MKITKRKNNGLTLIEALIWFAISATAMMSAFAIYNSYRMNQQSYLVSTELNHIYKYMKSVINSSPKSPGIALLLNKRSLMRLNVAPTTYKTRTSTKFESIFGITNITYNSNLTADERYSVEYQNIPQGKICSNIVLSQSQVGWTRVVINGTELKYDQNYRAKNVADYCKGKKTLTLVFWAAPYQPATTADIQDPN